MDITKYFKPSERLAKFQQKLFLEALLLRLSPTAICDHMPDTRARLTARRESPVTPDNRSKLKNETDYARLYKVKHTVLMSMSERLVQSSTNGACRASFSIGNTQFETTTLVSMPMITIMYKRVICPPHQMETLLESENSARHYAAMRTVFMTRSV